MKPALIILVCSIAVSAAVSPGVSGVRPGPITVAESPTALTVKWPGDNNRAWAAEFSLDPKKPLIKTISVEGKPVIKRVRPWYHVQTGTRHGGWDEFFDFPPSHPEGTRTFEGTFELSGAHARTLGDRVEVTFDGLKLGIFQGAIRYEFFPGSRLIEQAGSVARSVAGMLVG